ncbi:hypothetical protein F2P56_007542 [Juglans regia]|uniref:RNase H type-1 domain-containing protein n=2 Tax=Juglans regia TaxID=51240 RepID=A0A833XRK3_JUGRE|nr:uncharacterized protein LOC109000200 [Juglans regia]KAF5475772.1 hypothetical protein F2P56_007542 [Juglans regia]
MDVWGQGPTIIHKSSLRAEKFKDIFESLSAICDQQVLEFFIITARSIWDRRNKLIFEVFFQQPTQLASQSKILLEEFKAAHDRPITDIRGTQVMNWTPPPTGFLKINWDAAIFEVKGRIGLGIVVRDHGGNIVATKKINQSGFNDPLLAEVLGAFQAVMMAADLGMDFLFLEGDSSQVVKSLNSHVEMG